MAKRQNFVVGSTNAVTQSLTDTELNHAFDRYEILTADELDGVLNAVSDYSNDSSNEIANAIQSITGSAPTGATQSELAGALQQMRDEIETTSLTFKGYVSSTEPSTSDYDFKVGDIWIQSATMPTVFPVAIAGVWDGSAWTSTTSTYTQKDFDFFRNVNDNEGYYWFGGQWTVMSTDMDTTYFALNPSGKWTINDNMKNISNWSSNVTNCITYIPQDIKLELNNGTLTLKAGSKVWLPNGVDVFDEITIANDLTVTDTSNRTLWIGVNASGASIIKCVGSETGSPVAGTYKYYYDDTVNKCYQSAAGSTPQATFPIAIVTATSADGIVSIDQVFNGFGYCGCSTFVLGGVKALAPNGRNEDGTYKNTELNFTTPIVYTLTYATESSILCFLGSVGVVGYGVNKYFEQETEPTNFGTHATWLNTDTNIMYYTADSGATWTKRNGVYLGKMEKLANANITSLEPKNVFAAADAHNVMTTDMPQAVTAIKSLQAANDDEWQIKKLNADNTAATQTESTNGAFRVRDKNDLIMGDLRVIRGTNGTVTTSMYARNRATGSDVNAVISCSVDNAGNRNTYAPALDTANSILTTIANSKTQSGYFKLGNGMIIQWGFTGTSANPHNKTFTFPTPFSSDTSFSVVSVSGGADGSGWTDGITAQTSTGFTICGTTNGTSTNNNVRWIAIGY